MQTAREAMKASLGTDIQATLQTAREAMKAHWTVDPPSLHEALKASLGTDIQATLQTAREAMKAHWTVDPPSLHEALKASLGTDIQATLQTAREAMKAHWTVDPPSLHEALKASLGTDIQATLQTAREAMKAHWTVDPPSLHEALKALPRLDPALFGEAWDERLAAAVWRLDRAEDIIAAAPEPERAIEALATDTDTVREAAPPEVREGINKWVQWFWIYLAQKLVLDPALDPALEQAMEAAREMALRLVVVLMVITTEPTRPTPPPAPALQQPAALAPVSAPPEALILPGDWAVDGLPDIVLRAGPQAAERTVEFFTAQIRNPHTRAAYGTAVTRFFTWCDARGLALAQISPIAVATYIEEMQRGYRAPTIKQHLAAIRRLFDWLVIGQVVPTNPATSVRGPTHVVRTGKTPVLQPAEARLLLDSIDTSTLRGLRDRALLAVMVYSFARVSAVVGMRVEDYYQQG